MKKSSRENSNSKFFIIGLGNPGREYKNSRHNIGYKVLDNISAEFCLRFRSKISGKCQMAQFTPFTRNSFISIVLLRYSGYMNRSGEFIPYARRKMGLAADNLLVVLDNMDMQPGIIRIKKGGGDAGHKGLRSVIQHLGNPDFLRLYIGVGRPKTGISIVQHVLGNAYGEDKQLIERASARAGKAVLELLSNSYQDVNSRVNNHEA